MNWKSLIPQKKGGVSMFDVTIDIVLFAALLPVLVGFIETAKQNLTSTESIIMGLTTLFLVLALIFKIGKDAGLIKR